MLTFNQYGFLTPYAPILSDFEALERVFVSEFPSNTTRHAIFEQYKAFNARLLEIVPEGFMQWVNGSFVSREANPDDIDFVVFIDAAIYDEREREIERMRDVYRSERPKLLDSYVVRVYAENHRFHVRYHNDRVEWINDWTRTFGRRPKPKGFLEIHFTNEHATNS